MALEDSINRLKRLEVSVTEEVLGDISKARLEHEKISDPLSMEINSDLGAYSSLVREKLPKLLEKVIIALNDDVRDIGDYNFTFCEAGKPILGLHFKHNFFGHGEKKSSRGLKGFLGFKDYVHERAFLFGVESLEENHLYKVRFVFDEKTNSLVTLGCVDERCARQGWSDTYSNFDSETLGGFTEKYIQAAEKDFMKYQDSSFENLPFLMAMMPEIIAKSYAEKCHMDEKKLEKLKKTTDSQLKAVGSIKVPDL